MFMNDPIPHEKTRAVWGRSISIFDLTTVSTIQFSILRPFRRYDLFDVMTFNLIKFDLITFDDTISMLQLSTL